MTTLNALNNTTFLEVADSALLTARLLNLTTSDLREMSYEMEQTTLAHFASGDKDSAKVTAMFAEGFDHAATVLEDKASAKSNTIVLGSLTSVTVH